MAVGTVKVGAHDLFAAFDIANVASGYDNKAFVSLSTGKTYIITDYKDPDEEIPEDLETSDDYVALPSKRELGLGQDMVFEFVRETITDDWADIRDMFRRKGAFRRFKHVLGERNLLDQWYRFEEQSTLNALRAWCESYGLHMSDPSAKPGV